MAKYKEELYGTRVGFKLFDIIDTLDELKKGQRHLCNVWQSALESNFYICETCDEIEFNDDLGVLSQLAMAHVGIQISCVYPVPDAAKRQQRKSPTEPAKKVENKPEKKSSKRSSRPEFSGQKIEQGRLI